MEFEEKLSENTEINEEKCDDDAELLLEEYEEEKKYGRADDSAAMQAVMCLLIAAGLLIYNIFYPDTAGSLLSKLRQLSAGDSSIIRNPIDIITELWQS